jgi:hypothetical protein
MCSRLSWGRTRSVLIRSFPKSSWRDATSWYSTQLLFKSKRQSCPSRRRGASVYNEVCKWMFMATSVEMKSVSVSVGERQLQTRKVT